jgi:Terminase large subunit, T4likevirus-type, N-terminal
VKPAMASAKLPSVGLVAACDDPKLFAFPLWPRQRELLEQVEHGPRLHVWALGRRSGKTTLAALVGLHTCLFRPDIAECVRPGERYYAVGVATNLRQARLFVAAAASIVEGSELLRSQLVSSSEDELVFKTGGVLTAFPCSSRGGRGWPIASLLMDEAAFFVSDTEGYQTAERVFQALVPSTAQFGEAARIVLASTPFGTEFLFAEMWQRAASGELSDASAVKASTAEMNPTLDAKFLEQEEARDPESFRAEYLAEFVGSGGAFLDPERIAEAVADRQELSPEQATGWVAGLDPAFSQDPFGLAIVGRDRSDPNRLVLGRVQAWQPARKGLKATLERARELVSFEERRSVEDAVIADVAAVCRRYGARLVTDQYAAPQVVSRLRELGLSVRAIAMTASSKTEVFLELRARLNAGSLELYPDEQLLTELRRLRTRYSAGSSSVVNPRVGGSHGDMAQALALAVYEQRGVGSAFPFDPGLHVVQSFDIPSDFDRFEALRFGASSHWLELEVDYDGNLLVIGELRESGLPSQVAASILARREDAYRTCYAGPSEIVGRWGETNSWTGAPVASVLHDFSAAGVDLAQANDSRPAGFVRIGELLRPDSSRRFPDWHPRSGEPGSPGLFVFDRCPALLEQLAAAPLEEDDEPLPRAAISQRWETLHGAGVAALRFASMSRPSPSQRDEKPPYDPRARALWDYEQRMNDPTRQSRNLIDV